MRKKPRHISYLRALAQALSLAAAATGVSAQGFLTAAAHEQALAKLRETAAALPFIEPGALSSGRMASGPVPHAALAAHRAAIEATAPVAYDPAALQPLLDDRDPRVRLMAAYGMFRSCQPATLPMLAKLANDPGQVPALRSSLGLTMQMAEAHRRELPPLELTTVGAEVCSFLQAWGAPEPGGAAFVTWSARQQELAPTAAELRLRLRLVTQGSTPIIATSLELLDVYSHAMRAPRGAGEIAMIGLFEDKITDIVSRYPSIEQALECAARRLGRDNLLRLLRGEAPLIDGAPLAPQQLDGLVDAARRFVLARPARVGLEPKDAETLETIGKATDQHAMFRAAARLRPERATEILRGALARTENHFAADERIECAILLWELQPTDNRAFLENWFYEHVEPMHFVPEPRHRFALHLLLRYGAGDRAMFAALATDPRFDQVGPDALLAIVNSLNLMEMQPVVPPDSMLNFQHPEGLARAFRDLDGARQAWPEQTRTMLAQMDDWRQRIRAHVAPWRRAD